LQSFHKGSTALVAFDFQGHVIVANVGDSRAVWAHDKVANELSIDAKPENALFAKTIRSLGGTIEEDEYGDFRIGGILSTARAFGDFGIPGVCAVPKLRFISRSPDFQDKINFLILACDGVWDVMDSQDAVNLLTEESKTAQKSPAELAPFLVEKALEESQDNCTVMIIEFPKF
jgi:serine/threonine protein phosphatase PrpC